MTDKENTANEIKAELKRIADESLIAAERHFASEHKWVRLNYALGIPSVLLAAIAGTTAFAAGNAGANWTGGISLTVAVLAAISTYFDPIKKSSAHTSAAKAYQVLYNEIRLFLIDSASQSEKELMEQLRTLVDKLNQLNQSSPSLSRRSLDTATRKIKGNEGLVFQIDGTARELAPLLSSKS